MATPGVPGATANGVGLPATRKLVTVAAASGLSTSVKLASSPVAAGTLSVASSVTVALSSPSSGASLTGAMARVRVEVSVAVGEPLPSLTV